MFVSITSPVLNLCLRTIGYDQARRHFDTKLFGDIWVYKGMKHHDENDYMKKKAIEKKFRQCTVV